jgi:hypothetical protein
MTQGPGCGPLPSHKNTALRNTNEGPRLMAAFKCDQSPAKELPRVGLCAAMQYGHGARPAVTAAFHFLT